MLEPWQWFIGANEFVAAWWLTSWLITYVKHREPRTELTEHQRWIAEQDAMVTGEDGRDYRTSPTLHIPDDWRERMARKEKEYRQVKDAPGGWAKP